MPRTNMGRDTRFDKLIRLLHGYMSTNDKFRPEMAKLCGFKSRTTLHSRMEHPEDFTLGELTGLARGLHIPIDELREAIRY